MRCRLAVVVGLVVVATAWSYGVHRWRTSPVAFDRDLWLRAADVRDEGNWRNRMAEDVVSRRVHPGMTLAAALSMLGQIEPAQFGDGTFGLRYYTGQHWNYSLTGGADAVVIHFDRNKRVTRACRDSFEW